MLSDLDQSRVLEVVPGNDKQSGCALWQSLPQAQRKTIETPSFLRTKLVRALSFADY